MSSRSGMVSGRDSPIQAEHAPVSPALELQRAYVSASSESTAARLTCMTRLSDYEDDESITVTPMKAFPVIKDLVTDVSQAYRNNASIPRFRPRPPDADDGWRMQQFEIDRAQEMRKCIECFLCQDVCHVLRSHRKHEEFIGPTYLVRTAGYSLNPIDVEDRSAFLKESGGIGLCNITKCCTEVCPEHITITDNAIIPLKERVVDRFYDPVKALVRLVRRRQGRDA